MSFADPRFLLGLVLLPLLGLLEWRALRRADRASDALVGKREGHPLLSQRFPGQRQLGLTLRLAAFTLLVAGAAGPQWGRETTRRQSQGSDIVFLIDVSASMDVRDVPTSRLDEARREALGLLQRMEGSRVAVVAFAGDAIRLCPLTLDRAATALVLETIESGVVSMPGTDLGRALDAAVKALPPGRRDDQAVVLWTDGEDLEGRTSAAIDAAAKAGVRVFAVGVGTPSGDIIPILDDQGRSVDVKRDENGTVVRSRLDERLLRDLARRTRGIYFTASAVGGELPRLVTSLGSLARSRRGSRMVERPVARFPLCAGAVALLLAAELSRARRRRVRSGEALPLPPDVPASDSSGNRLKVAVALLALSMLLPLRVAAQTTWAKGDAAFQQKRWAEAESLYAVRAKQRGAPAAVKVNLATARARQGKADSVLTELSRLSSDAGAAGAAAGYNLGTLYGENKDYPRALAELRRTLERDPRDADARWNYELLKRQQLEAEQKQDPKNQPKQPDSSPQQPAGGGQGQGRQPQKQDPKGAPQAPQPSDAPPEPQPGQAQGMSREQADRLLGSLRELERTERQRMRRGPAQRERKGKDW